ncbi:ribosome maturation factor RimM [Buchnera aphidicola (Ceratoglyphina bambusae)]|uniref:ribosome maturation factor RimM n=1 Tax=Buchnera aphidicola TaxID=9 RepID=UPI0031B84480
MILIGKIIKPYGVLGWLKIISFTEKPKQIFKYLPWYYIDKENKYKKIKLKNWKNITKNKLLIKIKNINNRNISEKLVKKKIFIKKSSLPKLLKNEYYYKDIIGCKIYDSIKNTLLGTVKKIIDSKTFDVLVIKKEKNKSANKEILIPFIINKYIKNVDIYNKKITVIWNI